MLQGSALDVFPTRGPGLLSIRVWPVRPFLARLLYSLMRATPPTSKATRPAGVPPGWSPPPGSLLFPFSLGAEEIIWKRKVGETCGRAGQGGWQQDLPGS